MYQLLVTPHANDPSESVIELMPGRFLEHTDEQIASQVESLSTEAIECMKSWPCVLIEEGRTTERAHIALVKSVRSVDGQLRIELDRLTPDPGLTNESLWKIRKQLAITDFEFNRHHLAIKECSLFSTLASTSYAIDAGLVSRFENLPLPAPTRRSLIAAADIIAKWDHTRIDRFLLEVGIPQLDVVAGKSIGSRQDRANAIIGFVMKNPSANTADNSLLSVIIGREAQVLPAAATAQPMLHSQFRYLQKLPEGGYADVWLARDEQLQRDVAIKIVRPSMAIHDDFARDQARALARAAHANIVTVFGIGHVPDPSDPTNRVTGIVMEFVQGRTLTDTLAGAIEPRIASSIGLAIIAAVGWMHGKGLEHGDLHGKNVLVTADGGVKVIDILYLDSLKLLGTTQRNERQTNDLREVRRMLERLLTEAGVARDAVAGFGTKCHDHFTIEGLRRAFEGALPGGAVATPATTDGGASPSAIEELAVQLLKDLREDGNDLVLRKHKRATFVYIGTTEYFNVTDLQRAAKYVEACTWLRDTGKLAVTSESEGAYMDGHGPGRMMKMRITPDGYTWLRAQEAQGF